MSYIKKRSQRAKNIHGTADKPRLCVYKANANIMAQIINDDEGVTLAAVSTKDKDMKDVKANNEGCLKLGEALAEKATRAGVNEVVFDRRNYIYHGKIKALADGARKGGLQF